LAASASAPSPPGGIALLRRIAPIATAVPVGRPRRGADTPVRPLTAGETTSPWPPPTRNRTAVVHA